MCRLQFRGSITSTTCPGARAETATPKLDEWNERRRRIADQYLSALSDLRGLILPYEPTWADVIWHLYVIRHSARDKLSERLVYAGVHTMIHYPIPPQLQQAYAELGYREGDFPVAEAIHCDVLSLPIGPQLSAESVVQVSRCLESI